MRQVMYIDYNIRVLANVMDRLDIQIYHRGAARVWHLMYTDQPVAVSLLALNEA